MKMNRQDAIDEERDEHRDDDQEDQGTKGKPDRDSLYRLHCRLYRSSNINPQVINIHEDPSVVVFETFIGHSF